MRSAPSFATITILVLSLASCSRAADTAAVPPTLLVNLEYAGDVTRIGCLGFSADGKTLAVGTRGIGYKRGGTWEGEVVLWDTSTWKQRGSLYFDQFVNHIDISPDGRWLAASCFSHCEKKDCDAAGFKAKEGYIVIHDLRTLNEAARFSYQDLGSPKRRFGEVRFSSDGKSFLTVASSKVQIYDVPKFLLKNEIVIDDAYLIFSHDGKLLASSTKGFVELPSGKRRESVYLTGARFFSAKDSMLVLWEGRNFYLLDVPAQVEIDMPGLTDKKFRVDAAVISADERMLAASEHGDKKSWLHFFDLQKRKKLVEWVLPGYHFEHLTFSPDGNLITDGHKVWHVDKK